MRKIVKNKSEGREMGLRPTKSKCREERTANHMPLPYSTFPVPPLFTLHPVSSLSLSLPGPFLWVY